MRRFLHFVAGVILVVLAMTALPLSAQIFPSKPIRFVVPFPGGIADTLARLISPSLGQSLGQPVVVENRPGGSGQIAAQEIARSPADGHTLFMGHIATHAINASLFSKLSYDPDKDFTPVTLLVTVPNLLVVNPGVPAQSVRELVALAKAKPGSLSYASPGNGTSGHLAGELFKSLAGLNIVHVPYKGAAQAMQDVIGGHGQLLFDTFAQSYPQAKAGKLRALAITSLKRQASAPDIPTMDESGFAGWETGPWFGVLLRSGTAELIVRRVHAELVKSLNAPEARDGQHARLSAGAVSVRRRALPDAVAADPIAPDVPTALEQRAVRGLARGSRAAEGAVAGVRRDQRVVPPQRVRAEARPAVLVRRRDQARAHRVQLDVAHAGEQVPPRLKRQRFDALLPERAAALMRLVGVARVALGKRAHQARGAFRPRRRQQQVHVVAHQHVGVHGAAEALAVPA